MSGRIASFLLLLLLEFQAFGQFTMEGYLANAISDEELQYTKAKQAFLDDNKFNSPILREVEFRARIRNFGNGFEDYRLRFSPLNPFEKKANKNYHKALTEQLSLEYRKNLEEVLMSRYLVMIEHRKLSREIKLLEESQLFYQRVLAASTNLSTSSLIKEYIELDKTHLRTILKLDKAKRNLELLEQTIQFTYSFDRLISWDDSLIIDPATIKEWLSLQQPTLENNLYLKNELEKATVDALEFKIEKTESFRNLGYVQAEYREDLDQSFGENLGMQIAVNVPIVNADKPDLQRDKMDLFEDSKKLEIEKQELERYLQTHYSNLGATFKRLAIIEAKESTYAGNSFSSTSTNNALELMIELHEFRAELQELKISAEADILSMYIELLSLNGELSQEPYINYLSKENKTYEINQ